MAVNPGDSKMYEMQPTNKHLVPTLGGLCVEKFGQSLLSVSVAVCPVVFDNGSGLRRFCCVTLLFTQD